MFGRLTLAFIGSVLLVGCQTGSAGMSNETHWHTKIYRGVGENPDLKAVAHTTMTWLTPDRTRASVTLPGLLPRGEYAWGVYEGNCTSQGGIMGSESDYPMIVPDANSMGSFTATINDSFDSSGMYSLSIFRTGGARDEVLGCNVMRVGAQDEEDVDI
ncbi:hypothetical protein BH18GEM1_BH18GEM1_17230 [soil metagenome]